MIGADLKGPTSKGGERGKRRGRQGKGRGRKGRGGKGEGREEREGEREGRERDLDARKKSWRRHCLWGHR